MICLNQDEVPVKTLPADGKNTPMVLFFQPGGKLLDNINSDAKDNDHRYTYTNVQPILVSMRQTLKQLNIAPMSSPSTRRKVTQARTSMN